MGRTAFTVKGMTCDNCVNRVTEAIKHVDGVKVAKVTLADETAQVTFDPQQISVEQPKAAVKDAGYDVA
jgi:copper ion binding protein